MSSPNPGPPNLGKMEDPVLSPQFLSQEDTSTSSSNSSSSQHSGSPRDDWMHPGSIWNQLSSSKPQTLDDLSLNMSLNFPSSLSPDQWSSMDMDTDISAFMTDPSQHFSMDPNTLQFDATVFSESVQEQMPASGNYDSMFQFTLSQPSDAIPGPVVPFQLPTPKPGSMSSRSVSPALSKPDSDSSAGVNPSDLSLFTQLSQKAREASGVTLAVPVGQDSRGATDCRMPITPTSPVLIDSQVSQPKVPIPRLRPTALAPEKPPGITTMSQPTPPSSQPASSPPSIPQESVVTVPTTKMGRPKTSHTTIERRYRTNLNARILALRRAVPALRILEKNTATQTQGKGLTGASAPKWDFGELSTRRPSSQIRQLKSHGTDDVVNERGYVDGVKAAKKNSKGVVLGKAVEYIRALKRRETRLKHEAEGLRSLLSSLVGGNELLREWEREWRERFGGEEADEVDEDAEDNEEGEADADDGEDAEDGDSDEEDGRAKKRARVEKRERKGKTSPAPTTEKRKRGRPRKNPVSDAPVTALPHLVLQPPDASEQPQLSKYLLAAFVLFNFFSSNTPSSSPSAAHEGMVLSRNVLSDIALVPVDPTGWNVLQAINMLVSVLLLLSLIGPYLPRRINRLLPNSLLFMSPSSSPSFTSPTEARKTVRRLVSASASRNAKISRALASGDEHALRSALGANGSPHSVSKCIGTTMLRSVLDALQTRWTADAVVTRQDEMDLRGWRRVSQVEVLRGKNTSLLFNIQAYLSFLSKLPPLASPLDNITLALLARSFAASTAAKHWEAARHSDTLTSSETLVLEMDVEEVAKIISTTAMSVLDPSDEDNFSPVQHVAAHVVLARTKTLAARQFISSVTGQRLVDIDNEGGGTASPLPDDIETKTVVAAGRELGGPLGELTQLLDKVDRCPAAEVLATLPSFEFGIERDDESESLISESGGEGSKTSIKVQSDDAVKDTRLLLLATLLYRRIFPTEDATSTHVLSPPPSPTPKSAELHLALRRALASTAFDANPDTEDARDRVVDILAETRRGRSGGLY